MPLESLVLVNKDFYDRASETIRWHEAQEHGNAQGFDEGSLLGPTGWHVVVTGEGFEATTTTTTGTDTTTGTGTTTTTTTTTTTATSSATTDTSTSTSSTSATSSTTCSGRVMLYPAKLLLRDMNQNCVTNAWYKTNVDVYVEELNDKPLSVGGRYVGDVVEDYNGRALVVVQVGGASSGPSDEFWAALMAAPDDPDVDNTVYSADGVTPLPPCPPGECIGGAPIPRGYAWVRLKSHGLCGTLLMQDLSSGLYVGGTQCQNAAMESNNQRAPVSITNTAGLGKPIIVKMKPALGGPGFVFDWPFDLCRSTDPEPTGQDYGDYVSTGNVVQIRTNVVDGSGVCCLKTVTIVGPPAVPFCVYELTECAGAPGGSGPNFNTPANSGLISVYGP